MLVSENIGKHFFILLSANKRLNKMEKKSQILDFLAFYKMSQPFLIWGCKSLYVHHERFIYVGNTSLEACLCNVL